MCAGGTRAQASNKSMYKLVWWLLALPFVCHTAKSAVSAVSLSSLAMSIPTYTCHVQQQNGNFTPTGCKVVQVKDPRAILPVTPNPTTATGPVP
jgi:hypothetical protein